MDKKSCIVCRKAVTLGDSTHHRQCGHRTHNACLDMNKLDFAKCAHCKGEVDATQPLLPQQEPGSLSGVDYIENPLRGAGVLSKLRAVTSRLTGTTKEAATDPRYLLSLGPAQCPVDWLIREKDLGLQRFLEQGVTLDDFLRNGYSWDHLSMFQDLRADPPRVKKALMALGVNASHVQARQLGGERQWFTPREMVEQLGVYFPEDGGPLRCEGGYNWTAQELLSLGWKADDLFGAGMHCLEQYWSLQPTEADDEAFGLTEADFKQLCPEPAPRPVQQPEYVPQPRIVQVKSSVGPPVLQSGPRLYHGLRRKK